MARKVKLFGIAYLRQSLVIIAIFFSIYFVSLVSGATPTAPDSYISISNTTKSTSAD